MSGRVSSLYELRPGFGTDQRYVPLDQTTCFLLSFLEGQEWYVVCQRVRRVHQFLITGNSGFWHFLGLF